MNIDLSLIIWISLLAAIAMFAVGAVWYSVLFGKMWGEIHGFNKLSKTEQLEQMKGMGWLYGAQMLVTVFSAFVLVYFILLMPILAPSTVAFLVWFGFVLPSQVSAVMFSRTEKRYKLRQILIMSAESLAHLQLAAWIISLFGL